ncbi:hypothetical protein LHA31_10150 [Carnobacterium viridans]|uniref:Uncharacterized protein n=1 Tax=Carnobacterium viridans TaxID=174587 RepID=A0A1H0YXQ4_9LACT|nr:hypothetical protein [Carnobacterium viridans]UDE94907.1 hypothetical protein LHA31_10150 [Carnobacterium viridans]SDQ19636.1 hypothetical protein SAMN04487752_1198 [Carnobacterium viridans]
MELHDIRCPRCKVNVLGEGFCRECGEGIIYSNEAIVTLENSGYQIDENHKSVEAFRKSQIDQNSFTKIGNTLENIGNGGQKIGATMNSFGNSMILGCTIPILILFILGAILF